MSDVAGLGVGDDEAVELLRPWLGGDAPVLVGEGMEGRVYEIDAERIAKVWFTKTLSGLQEMRKFVNALAAKPLGFTVPEVFELVDAGRCRISIERRLVGSSLAERLAEGAISTETAHGSFVDILGELARSGPLPEGRTLPVMDNNEPLYGSTQEQFPGCLARLATSRRHRFAGALEGAVNDLHAKTTALVQRLHEVDTTQRTAIHGDLIAGNVLIEDDATSVAVLDWGFFSTEGDPAFDAAVACALFDMYGDHALATELALLDRVEDSLGYNRESLLVYRAAYSLITANAYTPDGNDGHFRWCAEALNRPDVVRALLG